MTSPPLLDELPSPPPGKTGWPWTQASPPLPPTLPDGIVWPRISIVTPSFNQGEFLEETIRSILLQGYPDLEYIIMDGGSRDESTDIIRRYEKWLTHWTSEKDGGQPHAINNGLALTTGTIFNWINSDDLLVAGALERIARAFGESDAVAGSIIYFGDGQEIVGENHELTARRILRDGGSFFQQPGIWLRRELLQEIGGVDENFHFAFDWDLAVRYFHSHTDVATLDEVLVRFRLHNESKTVSQRDHFRSEMTAILQKLMKLEEFQSLHATCAELVWRREIHALVLSAISAQSPRPLRALLQLVLHQPRVMGVRFFWGTLRQSVRRTSKSMEEMSR